MSSEKNFQTKILKEFRKLPCSKIIKYPGGMYGERGTPDLIGCINGRMVLIEVKNTGGKPTELQVHRLKEWLAAGAVAALADPSTDPGRVVEEVRALATGGPAPLVGGVLGLDKPFGGDHTDP